MTGADFYNQFNTKVDEVGSGFYDTTRLNDLVKSALIKIIDPLVDQFQRTKKVTREMQVIINTVMNVPISSGVVDISPTSSVVPAWYSEVRVVVTSPYGTGSLTEEATILNLNEGVSPFNIGDARYPKYYITNNQLIPLPSNATTINMDYFVAPTAIDVSNNTDQIPYNQKLIDLVMDMTIALAATAERDQFMDAKAEENVVRNP